VVNKYLVVGANSFSGSHFAAHLLSQGHEVVGLSRSPEPDYPFLPRLWNELPGSYSFHRIDLNSEGLGLGALIAEIMVAQSWEEPWDWFQTNTVGLSYLLHALLQLKSLKKYVHISTPEVYGSTTGWIPESWSFRPSTPYATSRAAGDWHVANLAKIMEIPAVLTRAANVYGPGQQLYRVIPRAFLSGMVGEPFPLQGEGGSTRSFIHIRDVCEATYLLAEGDFDEDLFHISTNELVSIRSLVSTIADMVSSDYSLKIVAHPERAGKDLTYQLDSSLLRGRTGWSDKITLEAGLGEVFDWAHRHFDVLQTVPRDYVHKS
jgi:dTDP-glucose 4,6-dehydratase